MPQASLLTLIAAARSGHLISFSTDTVPALAVQPAHAAKIYEAKGRSLNKPLILMAASVADLWPFVQSDAAVLPIWQQMADRCWPGAVTLVLPASSQVPVGMNTQTQTIGLRVPDWPFAQAILAETGPLATTSINRSGQPPLLDWDAIATQFPQVYLPPPQQWLLPTPASAPPLPSTVIQWQSSTWQILRQGTVSVDLSLSDRQ